MIEASIITFFITMLLIVICFVALLYAIEEEDNDKRDWIIYFENEKIKKDIRNKEVM